VHSHLFHEVVDDEGHANGQRVFEQVQGDAPVHAANALGGPDVLHSRANVAFANRRTVAKGLDKEKR